jgi:hypothetical protein
MASVNQDASLEQRWSHAIGRAGLVGDPYEPLLALMPEVLAELRASRTAPLDHRVLKQVAKATMSSEERKRWMGGCAVILAVGIVLAATAGWAIRDSQLKGRCMAAFPQRADVCMEIWR